MKDSINLWFIDNDKKKRVPHVFSKVLLNFMLGRYPNNVFEKFSKHRLEYILEELLTKITDKNFFSETRPVWWPESIEFVPIPILRQRIAKNALFWILSLQQLLLSAREFYAEQLYLSRRSFKHFKLIKNDMRIDKSERIKPKALPKSKRCIKISTSIFKPIRNENCHPNIPVLTDITPISNKVYPNDRKAFVCRKDVCQKDAIDRHFGTEQLLMNHFQSSFVRLEGLMPKSTPIYVPTLTVGSSLPGARWRPFVYLDDILRNQSSYDSIDFTTLKLYRSKNCTIKVCDILKPIVLTPVRKTTYMTELGLTSTPTTRQPQDALRVVNYKKYTPRVPFSSIGGQMIITSFKDRYRYNSNYERNGRRGCSINDPLRHKNQDSISNREDDNLSNQKKKLRSYHVYKFCRRRPLNSLELPEKIKAQYCRSIIVNVEQLNSDILKPYMKECKVILPRITAYNGNSLQKCRIHF